MNAPKSPITDYTNGAKGQSMMTQREYHYHWEWTLNASPEQLWPLVADTNRFDFDAGLPAYAQPEQSSRIGLTNTRRQLRIKLYGVPLDWVEEPFEWVRPFRFQVTRNYKPGPIPFVQPLDQLRIKAHLQPTDSGGTHLSYDVWATPRNLLGRLAIPLQIGQLYARRFDAVFRQYDQMAAANQQFLDAPRPAATLPMGGRQRLAALREQLIAEGSDRRLVDCLVDLIEHADDLTLNQLRPYQLADHWQFPRRSVLEVMLLATRLGLLDFQWELLCPMCRGGKKHVKHLAEVNQEVHCDTCNIHYKANFERSVELTFRPNSAVRDVPRQVAFCSSGPEATPHIATQQLLAPGAGCELMPGLEAGRYRLRASQLPGAQFFRVETGGERETAVTLRGAWPLEELALDHTPTLRLQNATDNEQLLVLERVAWTDTAATAAEVTTLQRFRDLFAEEALRPGDQISVGSQTILFTDLVESTRMYREIGDATAFGLVMDHFDVLRKAIREEEGAIVKTIGDAVMAVFRRPVSALRAVHAAQQTLNALPTVRPLRLKAAIHHGPSIAVTLNERLDYFGSSVNIASRLEKFSQGGDIVISAAVHGDPEVQELLHQDPQLNAQPFEQLLKGFDEESFTLWRVQIPCDISF